MTMRDYIDALIFGLIMAAPFLLNTLWGKL